jgi:outer membrane lipoprotein-sorting protein
MKKIQLLFVLIAATCFTTSYAQTADEIINKYLKATGGVENWQKLEGVKMSAKVNQGGMEIPLDIFNLKDGRQMTTISLQGKVIKQGVYDGTNLWSTNFMTMKAEKSDAETTEMFKTGLGDFPDPFLNYAAKGYKLELIGKETVEGTETFKIKLTKKPFTIEGKTEENVSFYFFDAEEFIPIMVESEIKVGPAKGKISQITMSDYQEVSGLFFPFSLGQGVKGMGSQPITLTKIELNPQVDPKEFVFTEEK